MTRMPNSKKRSDYKSDIDSEIIRLYNEEHLTMEQIVERLHISTGTIHNHFKYLGVKIRSQGKIKGSRLRLNKDPVVLSYIAAIIDGEGSIWADIPVKKHKFQAYVIISNTSRELMDWLVKNTGVNVVYIQKRQKGVKVLYKWDTRRITEVLELLKAVAPYMVVKKDHAEEVIRLCEARIEEWNNAV